MLYSHKLLVFAPSCPSAGVCVCVCLSKTTIVALTLRRWLCDLHVSAELSNQLSPHEKVSRFLQESIWTQLPIIHTAALSPLIWFHAGAYITKIKQGNADLTYFITTNLSVSAKPNSASCSSTISRSLFLTKQFWLNCRLKELQVPKNCHPREHDVRRELPWRMGGSGQQEPCLQLLLSASID